MRRDRLLRELLRERFLITMKSGAAFDGLLDRFDESTIELLDPHMVGKDGRLTAIDGRMCLPRREIDYMQRPDAT